MVSCRGCAKLISIDCPYCPHCGKPCGMRSFTPAAVVATKPKFDTPIVKVALLAAVGLFTIILWQLYSRFSDPSQNPSEQKTSQSASAAQ